LVYTGIHFWKEGSYEGLVWENYLMFAASATLTLFAYLLVYVFEKAFKMVTDITLLELSNTSNPVLRELSSNAPGTFQHSMQVANLAEEAIREIGGNALLVRAGAMFHDIGKLVMPQFFVENQQAGHNPHDDLSSEESARIIVSHVIKGIEMARKRGLPEPILDFIRTHHGTRKADYFYLTYKQQNPDETFDETVFTYPGPKPFSKETAVVMIADSVEAASRSLNAPDENKIDKLVDGIIDKLFEERQLVNADITLKELKNVGKVLKRQLMNIHHVRMVYPSA
jgi:putative nucleotidyltransferase with HDIG domain